MYAKLAEDCACEFPNSIESVRISDLRNPHLQQLYTLAQSIKGSSVMQPDHARNCGPQFVVLHCYQEARISFPRISVP
jgi:hypothetical protein